MPKTKKSLIVLGIDPGIADTGFGVVSFASQKMEALAYGSIKTAAGQPMAKRLTILAADLKKIIARYRPEVVGVEQLFFAKNAKTAMAVGQARGVVLLIAAQSRLPIKELTPLKVKSALVGYGKASKLQIQQMVKTLLKLESIPKPDDAADALAVAICVGR